MEAYSYRRPPSFWNDLIYPPCGFCCWQEVQERAVLMKRSNAAAGWRRLCLHNERRAVRRFCWGARFRVSSHSSWSPAIFKYSPTFFMFLSEGRQVPGQHLATWTICWNTEHLFEIHRFISQTVKATRAVSTFLPLEAFLHQLNKVKIWLWGLRAAVFCFFFPHTEQNPWHFESENS